MTSLDLVDKRTLFTRALLVLRNGKPCPESILRDFSGLIVELSKKHFGVTSEVMVEAARDAAVAVVSEGLFILAGKDADDQKLAAMLASVGVIGACRSFSEYVKSSVSPISIEPTTQVFFNFCNTVAGRGWRAGHEYLEHLHFVAMKEAELCLVRDWLVANTTQGRIAQKQSVDSGYSKDAFGMIRFVLLQYCSIKDFAPIDFEPQTEDDFKRFEESIFSRIMLGPVIFNKAKVRYTALVNSMPESLRWILNPPHSDSWFDQHIIKKSRQSNVS